MLLPSLPAATAGRTSSPPSTSSRVPSNVYACRHCSRRKLDYPAVTLAVCGFAPRRRRRSVRASIRVAATSADLRFSWQPVCRDSSETKSRDCFAGHSANEFHRESNNACRRQSAYYSGKRAARSSQLGNVRPSPVSETKLTFKAAIYLPMGEREKTVAKVPYVRCV